MGQRELIKKAILLSLACFVLISCSAPEENDYDSGLALISKKEYKSALALFDRVILRSPESNMAVLAAREGAKTAFLDVKDFKKAAEYYRFLVLSSTDAKERLEAQKQLSVIYFEHLTDYKTAVIELNKLLILLDNGAEKTQYKMNLAKAYYFQNNFVQSESEVDNLLKKEKSDDVIFQMLVLKGNIYLARKDIIKATDIFKDVLKKYPERAVKENVASALAVSYEEMKDFKSAIAVLQEMRQYHSMPEYIDLRIKRLMATQKNQPGAKGLRRK